MKSLPNFIDGKWETVDADHQDVVNPATAETIAKVPMSGGATMERAVDYASAAFPAWRRTPATDRVQFLFKLKHLLEENFEAIAKTTTEECGKTIVEARGELRRGIENVETACGIPAMIQGYNNEDIAPGIDEMMIRQPLGVVSVVTPFNFPAMIPLWFLPYAIACGNTCVVKPSEKVPLTLLKIFELIEKTGLPRGVAQLVNGGKEAVDGLLDNPAVRAVSFVGSTDVARYIYERAAKNGKRAQCQGGAKNPIVILPDADLQTTTRIAADSAFGCAGQRCLAASVAITVGDARRSFTEAICAAAEARTVGFGLDEGVEMGPLISSASKARVEGLIGQGVEQGAELLVDGRGAKIDGYGDGFFVKPTVLENVDPASPIAETEIFGPVLSMMHVDHLDDAISLVNDRAYGNMACLFTSSGAAARKFRYEAKAGNIGINLGVAAPMAFFPFSGWSDSFFGDLHGQGWDAIEFYTEKKVVIERWPTKWSRKF